MTLIKEFEALLSYDPGMTFNVYSTPTLNIDLPLQDVVKYLKEYEKEEADLDRLLVKSSVDYFGQQESRNFDLKCLRADKRL